MEYSLVMKFTTDTLKDATLTINGVKDNLDQSTVSALMDTIIEKGIFIINGRLLGKISAQVVETTTTVWPISSSGL